MAKHIYVSSSIQDWNAYAGGGTEELHMQPIGNRVAAILWEHGFLVSDNNPTMTFAEVIAESDKLKPDIHVAIHSNAGGGEGTEVYCWPGGRSEKLANLLYAEVAPLSPGNDRGVKDGRHLGEISKVDATSALIEVEFHDNEAGAKWIAGHHEELAVAIARAICRFYDVPFRALTSSQQIADAQLIVHGKEIPGGAKIIDGKAYTWTRGLAEALGLRTDWDAATKTVTIGTPVITLPDLEHRSNCDVITCKPSQLAVATVKKRLTVDGINASFFNRDTLESLGVVIINHQVIADRVPHRQPRPVFIVTRDGEAIISPAVESVNRLALDEVVYAVGAGPNLLPVLDLTDYPDDIVDSTRERSAVGITPQGLVKLVATDPMTMQQLQALMRELGCRFSMALDGGGSQTMRFGGKAIRDGGRAISTALILREG